MSKNTSISFGIGILAGVLAGVAAGLLYAPESGEKMREKVKNAVDDLSDNVPDEVITAKDSAIDMLEKTKLSIESQIDKVNETMKANKLAQAKEKEAAEAGYEF